MLSGDNNSSLSVLHDKFSIHAHINHLCRMLFSGGRLTSLAHSALVGGNRRTTSLVQVFFSSRERNQTLVEFSNDCSQMVENLGFP